MTPDNHQEAVKAAMDIISVSTLAGWVLGALPAVATILTIIWTLLRIWESPTFQKWWTGSPK